MATNQPARFIVWMQVVFAVLILPGAALFLSGWSLDWPIAWLYLSCSLVFFAASRIAVACIHPDTLRERSKMLGHANTKSWDRVLSPLAALAIPLLILVVAGFDRRLRWSPPLPLWVQWTGFGVYVACYGIGSWALAVNRFFSGVVRIQSDRGHTVVANGPYSVVRHPGYSSSAVGLLSLPLFLDAPWAFLPAVVAAALFVVRTALEDRTLRAELDGYDEYALRTRYRLLPGIW